jgi:hypothetical protein
VAATAQDLREKAALLLKQAKELEKAQYTKAGELAFKFLDKHIVADVLIEELKKLRGEK